MQNKYANLKVVSNPIVNQSLCTIRAKDTDTQGVRLAARKLTRILLYEATKHLPQKDIEIETPLTKFETKTVNPEINIIISPILRAGLIFTDEAVDILIGNINNAKVPLTLISQYMPSQYTHLRENKQGVSAQWLIKDKIKDLINDYIYAIGM